MTSTDLAYFERMYAESPDPWNFATSSYERRKYALTVAALPKEHFHNVFEPGCSIGVLSEMLAPMCTKLLATDIIAGALDQATARLQRFANVLVEHRAIPEQWPEEIFDLVVLSEIAYYFDPPTLRLIVSQIVHSTDLGSYVMAVHWRGETNYPLSGDVAHTIIDESEQLSRTAHYREEDFVLDLWMRVV